MAAGAYRRVRAAIGRLLGLGRRAADDAGMREEMAYHLDRLAARYEGVGLSAEEARRRAMIEFGGVTRQEEAARDAVRSRPLEDAVRDVRLALRALRRRPGYTAVALLTLGIGIGANTAIFSAVHAVLLRPLPYARPERLVVVKQRDAHSGYPISASIPNYRDWGQAMTSFAHDAVAAGWSWVVTRQDGPAEVANGEIVLGSFFETLGVKPHLGQVFSAAATERGTEPVAVLSYAFWQAHFGGDPAVVGRRLLLDRRPFTVVGVLPPGWGWPDLHEDVYVPMGAIDDLPWNARNSGFGAGIIARLRPGVTIERARAEMTQVGREVAGRATSGAAVPSLESLEEYMVGDVRAPLLALAAGVLFVLLIGVANVANLQLARGEDRRRDMAVRSALGAGRGRLVRQLLAESLVLSAAGGALGVGLAWLGVRALIPLLPSGIPSALRGRVGIDAAVLAFAAGTTLVAGIVFGLVPALRAAGVDPVHEIKADRRTTPRRGGLRAALVVAEVALAMVLLVGAGLMLRSFEALRTVDKGFNASSVLTARTEMPPDYADLARWTQFYDRLLERMRALPRVRVSAAALMVPLSHRSWDMGAVPEGTPLEAAGGNSFLFDIVSEDYFHALGVPIVAGRDFVPSDRAGATPVAIVDERMAQRFWPGESALGKRVFLSQFDDGPAGEHRPVYRTVVGVVGSIRHSSLQSPSRMEAYIPLRQTDGRHSLWLFARTTGDPTAVAPAVRRLVTSLDPDVPLHDVRTMQSWVDDALSSNRTMARLFTLFGALALALAGIGLFGVMSYTVAQQTREIGIRMALGADARAVLAAVLRRGAALGLLGVAIGLGMAPPLVRLVRGLLYQVSPFNAAIYGALAVFLLAVAVLAAYLPARRATAIDPMTALRAE